MASGGRNMFVEKVLQELLPANPADSNFFDIITHNPWKDPVPAVIFFWTPLVLLTINGASKIYSRLRR